MQEKSLTTNSPLATAVKMTFSCIFHFDYSFPFRLIFNTKANDVISTNSSSVNRIEDDKGQVSFLSCGSQSDLTVLVS